ncbi:hypothetical protein D3C81_2149700 [compost metagenome]
MFWKVMVTFLSLFVVFVAVPLLVLSGAALDAALFLLLSFELPHAATLNAIAAVNATVNVVFIFLLTMNQCPLCS